MKLDRTFTKEIKAVNGNGSREDRFKFLDRARECAKEMSSPAVRDHLNDYLKKYGRATVGICLASTIVKAEQGRLLPRTTKWGQEVIELWTNRPNDVWSVCIHDGMHPTRIEEYAGDFIRLTIEGE